MKKTFYADDDFIFSYEEEGDVILLHCVVGKWSLGVYKRTLPIFNTFLNKFKEYKIISISPNPKFCELFGAYEIDDLGNGIKVMKWAQG